MQALLFFLLLTSSALAQVDFSNECRVGVSFISNADQDNGSVQPEAAFEEALIEQSLMVVPSSQSPDITVRVTYYERWTAGLFPNCMCNFGQTKKKSTSIQVVDSNGVSIYSSEHRSSLNRRDIIREARNITNRLMRSRLQCRFGRAN